jgi:uncharacterized protein (DUF736 family)
MSEKKESIGALWLKESQRGNRFMSGVIEIDGKKTDIVIFRNDKGGVEKRPDYRIFESTPRGESNDNYGDVPF